MKVVEIFKSIDGEGIRAGLPVVPEKHTAQGYNLKTVTNKNDAGFCGAGECNIALKDELRRDISAGISLNG